MNATAVDQLPAHIAEGLSRVYQGEMVPPTMWEPIARYLLVGDLPGDFLRAVICNEFDNAVLRADHANRGLLRAFAGFFNSDAPPDSRGSREAMERWHDLGGMRGIVENRWAPNEGDRVRARTKIKGPSYEIAKGAEGVIKFLFKSHRAANIDWGNDRYCSATLDEIEKWPPVQKQ